MNLGPRYITKVVGIVLVVMSIAMLPSFFVSALYGERAVSDVFVASISFNGVLGIVALLAARPKKKRLKIRDGFIIIVVSWITAAIVAAVPFYVSGAIPSPVDAFFECCSGLSTTGATTITDVEVLPKGLLFWRSFTHWIGGLGFLRFAVVLMPTIGISGRSVFASETPGPMLDDFTPKMLDTAKTITLVYFVLTALETIFLLLGDMSLYDALVHTFGTVGTGGFSNYNDSIAHFDSVYIKVVITIFMAVSGMNYTLFFLATKKGSGVFLKDTELRCYVFFLLSSALIVFVFAFLANRNANPSDTLVDSAFQTTSILTTTGYITYNYELWPRVCQIVILTLMFIGGCASSTSGGIKVIRIVILLRLMKRGIYTRLHPHVVNTPTLYGKRLMPDAVSAVANHFFLYVFMVFIGTFLISFENIDMTSCFTAVISCLGNIGPGFSMVGPVENYAFMSGASKIILSLLMIAGRLELFAMFMFFTPHFWRPNR